MCGCVDETLTYSFIKFTTLTLISSRGRAATSKMAVMTTYCISGPTCSVRCVDQSEAELKGGGGYTHTHTHIHTHTVLLQQKKTNMAEALWVLKNFFFFFFFFFSFMRCSVRFSVWGIEVFSECEKHESVGLWIHFSRSLRGRRLLEGRNISCSRVLSHFTRLTHLPFQHIVEESQCADFKDFKRHQVQLR